MRMVTRRPSTMTDTAIRVENLTKRYKISPREPYKALRDIITDVFAAPFHRLRENSQFEIRNVSPAAYCLLRLCSSVALWL